MERTSDTAWVRVNKGKGRFSGVRVDIVSGLKGVWIDFVCTLRGRVDFKGGLIWVRLDFGGTLRGYG